MKFTLRKTLALIVGAVALGLIAAGWFLQSLVYFSAGLAAAMALVLLFCLMLYRHMLNLIAGIEYLNSRTTALQGRANELFALARQGARVDKSQVRSMEAMIADQGRLIEAQGAFEASQQRFAERLLAVEETSRVASRQAGDAQGLALRTFQDLAAQQSELAVRSAEVVRRIDEISPHLLSGMQGLLASTGEQLGALGESLQALRRAQDAASGRADEIVADIAGVQAALEPFMDVSGKQLRQIIRDVAAAQAALTPFIETSGEQAGRIVADLAAVQAALGPFMDVSGKQLRQIIRDVAASQAALAPFMETSGKQLRQIIRETDSGKAAVVEFLADDQQLKKLSHRAMDWLKADTVTEVEALIQLQNLFDLKGVLPPLGGWAMEPPAMLSVVEEVLRRKPALVAECGSGASTLWVAYALARNGTGRLVSLEHLEEFAEQARRALAEHGLADRVDVRHAPLESRKVGDEEFQWYSDAATRTLEGVDVLIVDGPPRSTGPQARYPALPLLLGALSDAALVIVDDANRREERLAMQRWQDEVDGLGEPWNLSPRTLALEFRRSSRGVATTAEPPGGKKGRIRTKKT